MKESEKYKLMSRSEENDFKAWTYHFKSERFKREENFKIIYEEIKDHVKIEVRENGSYTFQIEGNGKCDFYPKSNKVLIRSKNKWITNGLEWILKRIKK